MGERTADWTPPSDEILEERAQEFTVPTDNWPFLYLKSPVIPVHYLFFMLLVIILGGASFFLVERKDRQLNLQFFFLGAGFLLLETRSVTEIALLFGSTWLVNAIAFTFILLAVLGANLLVSRWRNPPIKLLYAGITILLVLGYLLKPGVLYLPSLPARLALAGVVLYSPIFLAGIIFSTLFKNARNPNLLFGSNLLGAMVGGALEYFSLVLGFQPLYLAGAALYLLAFLASRARK
jgi:hypothetical protein